MPDHSLNGYGSVKAKHSRNGAGAVSRNGYVHAEMTNRIREVARERGLTVEELAHRAGASQSTISRLIAGPDRFTDEGKQIRGMRLTQDWMEKLAEAAGPGVRPGDFLPLPDQPSGFAEEAVPFAASEDSAITIAVDAIRAGRNAADPWVLKGRALEDLGFLPGDVIIVDLAETPRAGDIVCAQLYREGAAETVFRLYEPPFLIGAGPGARRPIDTRGADVAVKGVVIALLRPRLAR